MVLWCKLCGALMGPREPLDDWSTDRDAICESCAEKLVCGDLTGFQNYHGEETALNEEAKQPGQRDFILVPRLKKPA